jgi:hypothetical protein
MRTIRWAAEKTADPDERTREIGYAALIGLVSSEMLQPEDERFLELVTEAALTERLESMPSQVDTGTVGEVTP